MQEKRKKEKFFKFFSSNVQVRIMIGNETCKENFNIKLVFDSFKIKNIFHVKTQILMI